jgi:hypothetical protein
MTSFAQSGYSTRHSDAHEVAAALPSASELHRGFDSAKGMAAVLLAAIVSALLVVAEQILDTWADGHLMVIWVALWAVGFVAIALLAGTVRRFSAKVVAALDGWAAGVAQSRADERLWAVALKDARVMAELQSALARDDANATLSATLADRARALPPTLTGGAVSRQP